MVVEPQHRAFTALSAEEIARYQRDNFVAPLECLSTAEARAYRDHFEAYEKAQSVQPLQPSQLRKLHVREPWAAELIRHPRIIAAVEALIGPDLLVFNSTFFIKEPGGEQLTAWHQDATYFGLQPHQHVSAWIALSDAPEAAGCMQFVASSSSLGQLRHASQAVAGSVNHGGQAIIEKFERAGVVAAPLQAGQFSLHHTLVVHSSGANTCKHRRIGCGISYIPTHVRHTGTVAMTATLVHGRDSHQHFQMEPDPRDHDAETNARNHAQAYRKYRQGYDEQVALHNAACQ